MKPLTIRNQVLTSCLLRKQKVFFSSHLTYMSSIIMVHFLSLMKTHFYNKHLPALIWANLIIFFSSYVLLQIIQES